MRRVKKTLQTLRSLSEVLQYRHRMLKITHRRARQVSRFSKLESSTIFLLKKFHKQKKIYLRIAEGIYRDEKKLFKQVLPYFGGKLIAFVEFCIWYKKTVKKSLEKESRILLRKIISESKRLEKKLIKELRKEFRLLIRFARKKLKPAREFWEWYRNEVGESLSKDYGQFRKNYAHEICALQENFWFAYIILQKSFRGFSYAQISRNALASILIFSLTFSGLFFLIEPQRAHADTQTLTATGSWQAPVGVTSLTITMRGGGAAGGIGARKSVV